jgi:glutathione peroxidase
MQNIYAIEFNNAKGEKVSFKDYKGKVVLIINTATACGFTPQLSVMQEVYDAFKDEEFEILAFPSNDFSEQEPLEGEAINDFCELNFNTKFPVMEKLVVKGENSHPLFQYLSDKKANGFTNLAPLWNFHKYLIDKKGYVRAYYLTTTSPAANKVKKKIKKLLAE